LSTFGDNSADELAAVCVILARAPSAGGKTRLTAGLSPSRACELREALLPMFIAYTPAEARPEIERLVPDARAIPQDDGDLGDRMRQAIESGLAGGAGAVVLVGSDLPTLPAERLADACAMLGSGADIVLGPAEDGGFYLIASRAPLPPAMFGGVTWSTPAVLAQVIDNAHASDLIVAILPPWRDVDVPEDLPQVAADPRPDAAPRVRAWVRRG
jgi:uncharacterized protein